MLDFADPKFAGWCNNGGKSELEVLEDNLNKLWVARCKANDNLLEFCDFLVRKGYKFGFSDKPTEQLKITKSKEPNGI